LDYTHEARNTDRLREKLAKQADAKAPRVFWEYTTPKALTIERIRGDKVTDIAALRSNGIEPKAVAHKLISAFLQQIFIDGFFHADPHPGNVLVTPDGAVAIVDCGQAGRLDHVTKSGLLRLLIAFEQQNARDFSDELLSIGVPSGPLNVREFTHDISKLLRRYYDLAARDVNIGDLLSRVLSVSAHHRVRFPAQFALLAKVFAQLDGTAKLLDPDFSFTEAAKPYIGKAVRTELNLEGLMTEMLQAVADAKHFAFTLPDRANELLRRLVEGTLRLEGRVQGIEDLTTKLDKVGNRLSFALICSGMVVASSIIVASGKGQAGLFGLPTLGVIGYIVTAIFGIWLLVSIVRGGRL
jgi:ubiquinone biosynthesis protein